MVPLLNFEGKETFGWYQTMSDNLLITIAQAFRICFNNAKGEA